MLDASRRWYRAIRKRMARARGSSPLAAARRDWLLTNSVTARYSSSSGPSMWKSTVCGMRFVKIFRASHVPSACAAGSRPSPPSCGAGRTALAGGPSLRGWTSRRRRLLGRAIGGTGRSSPGRPCAEWRSAAADGRTSRAEVRPAHIAQFFWTAASRTCGALRPRSPSPTAPASGRAGCYRAWRDPAR